MIQGIVPVAITPFQASGGIDYEGYARLLEWYIANGADAIFAVCQSSEMFFLSLDERIELARASVEIVRGRVPLVVSGHISDSLDDQKRELIALSETGADALVLVSNRLDVNRAGTEHFIAHARALLDALPGDVPIGLYECPAPYRRLITDHELSYLRDTGRLRFIKDVSCDLDVVKRRMKLLEGSGASIVNANAAISLAAMRAGAPGFCGVMNNFVPDLYQWLLLNGQRHVELADELHDFLTMAALSEAFGYPVLAKLFHKRIGTFKNISSRTAVGDIHERFYAIEAILDSLVSGAERFRQKLPTVEAPEAG